MFIRSFLFLYLRTKAEIWKVKKIINMCVIDMRMHDFERWNMTKTKIKRVIKTHLLRCHQSTFLSQECMRTQLNVFSNFFFFIFSVKRKTASYFVTLGTKEWTTATRCNPKHNIEKEKVDRFLKLHNYTVSWFFPFCRYV